MPPKPKTRNAKSSTRFHFLTKGLLGLSLISASSLAYAQSYAPNQYPQSPPQSNSQFARQPFPGQSAGRSTSAPNNLEPVFIKSHDFNIPLNISSRGANRPAEVHLFVSRDSGRNWEFYSRETPDAAQFAFSAPGDGDYWFAVRPGFGDPTANLVSPSSLAPSLRIAVDTSQPNLDLDASAEATGTTAVTFSVQDNAPSASGIQIYYRTDAPESTWLALDSNRITWLRSDAGNLTGKIVFDPQVDWRRISLHIVATDLAGNQSTAQKVVERPRVAGTPALLASAPQTGAYGFPTDNTRPNDSGYATVIPQPALNPPSNLLPNPTQPNPAYISNYQTNPVQPPSYRGFTADPTTGTPPEQTANNPPVNALDRSLQQSQTQPQLPRSQASISQQTTIAPTQPNITAQPNSTAQPNITPQPNSTTQPRSPSSAFRALEVETLPAPNSLANQPANPQSMDSQSASATANNIASSTEAQQPRSSIETQASNKPSVDESNLNYSRQAEFSLDYEFDSVGSRGIKKIELWGTRDAGQTWDFWGEDPDNESPFDVVTQGQGVYGFRIVAVDSQNLTSPTPQPGDEPEILIMVDKTAPLVKLVSASYGEGAEAGSLVIEYTYSDSNPISRPISLSFGESPSGPWTTIATGLENSGRYVWPADPRLPKNMYLRVEATDRAGNTGIEVSPNPISLRGLAPTARIKGFQPLMQDR